MNGIDLTKTEKCYQINGLKKMENGTILRKMEQCLETNG